METFVYLHDTPLGVLKAKGGKKKLKDFKKYHTLNASPEEVYLALTNPATVQLWTGEKAEMSTDPGSEFSLWDESITGKNLEFETNKSL